MTTAVCFKCGAIKFGAFCPCHECSAWPESEDELVLSLAMTEHYLNVPALEQMGADIRNGKPVQLDPQMHEQLTGQVRGSGLLEQTPDRFSSDSDHLFDEETAATDHPWWRFW